MKRRRRAERLGKAGNFITSCWFALNFIIWFAAYVNWVQANSPDIIVINGVGHECVEPIGCPYAGIPREIDLWRYDGFRRQEM